MKVAIRLAVGAAAAYAAGQVLARYLVARALRTDTLAVFEGDDAVFRDMATRMALQQARFDRMVAALEEGDQ